MAKKIEINAPGKRTLDPGWFVYLVLAGATLAVYFQVHQFAFVNYDDNLYISDNEHVKAGLTFEGIRWAFTTGHASNWHPVTWMSHMLDVTLFGEEPAGHHLENVLFHIVNACLLFYLLRRMTSNVWCSAFAAALFAIHPLHVESVAWVAERKDVLSTFFWLAAMIAYVAYVRRRGTGLYLLTLVLYAVGLMSKPMLVTLPAVLLLMDFWPLRRIDQGAPLPAQAFRFAFEKLPFLALAAASSTLTFIAQHSGHSVTGIDVLPIGLRFGNAIVSYAHYILMMVWPVRLTVFYPHPGPALPMWQVAASLVFLIAVSIPAVLLRRSKPYLLVGWLWYLGTLVPVIGIVQVGAQALADRYTYVPFIGLFIMIAWGGRDLGCWILDFGLGSNSRPAVRSVAFAVPAGVVLLGMSVLAMVQVSYWKDSVTLFQHALRVTSGNYLAHKNLGVALAKLKRNEQAAAEYLKGIAIKSNDPDLYFNLGNALDELGRRDESVERYRKAIQIDRTHKESHYNLANVLARQEKFDEALTEYGELLKLDPAHLGGLINMGNTLAMLKRPAEAMPYYQEALKLDPGNEEALTNLGNVLAEQNRLDEALQYYTRSIERNPNNADTYGNMAFALMKLGRPEEAGKAFSQVLRLDPSNVLARENLRAIESARGKTTPPKK